MNTLFHFDTYISFIKLFFLENDAKDNYNNRHD